MGLLRPCFYTPIGGTHAWDENPSKTIWWEKDSPLVRYLQSLNLLLLRPQHPFQWSTELDGIPLIQPAKHVTWKASALHLVDYFNCPRNPEPIGNVNLIAHSHGGQVVFYAAAYGLRINNLITVGTPVRRDMETVILRARPNINYWLHIYDSRTDWTAILGTLFDRKLRLKHKFDLADRNDDIRGIGHSEILTDPDKIKLWSQELNGKTSWASVLSYGELPAAV